MSVETCQNVSRQCLPCNESPVANISNEIGGDGPRFIGFWSQPDDPRLDEETWESVSCIGWFISRISQADADAQAKAVCVEPEEPEIPTIIVPLNPSECPDFTSACIGDRSPGSPVPYCTYQGQTFVFDQPASEELLNLMTYYMEFAIPIAQATYLQARLDYQDARKGCWYTAYPVEAGTFTEAALCRMDDGQWHIFFKTGPNDVDGTKSYNFGALFEGGPYDCHEVVTIVDTHSGNIYANHPTPYPRPIWPNSYTFYCGSGVGVDCFDDSFLPSLSLIECGASGSVTVKVCEHETLGSCPQWPYICRVCDLYSDTEYQYCIDTVDVPAQVSFTQTPETPYLYAPVLFVEITDAPQVWPNQLWHRGAIITDYDTPCMFGIFQPLAQDILNVCGDVIVQCPAISEPVLVDIYTP